MIIPTGECCEKPKSIMSFLSRSCNQRRSGFRQSGNNRGDRSRQKRSGARARGNVVANGLRDIAMSDCVVCADFSKHKEFAA